MVHFRLKEEGEKFFRSMAKRLGQSWKPTWRDSATDRDFQRQMAIHRDHADALEALLTHYPWIVYFGFSFWRKLLIQVWTKPSTSFPTTVLPQLTAGSQKTSLGRTEFGVLGALSKFSSNFLPRIYLKRSVPLAATHWQRVVPAHNSAWWTAPAANVGQFLRGLIVADQVDVLRILVEDLQLDISTTAAWRYFGPTSEASPHSLLWTSMDHVPAPSNRIPMFLLRQRGANPHEDEPNVGFGGATNRDTLLHTAARGGCEDVTSTLLNVSQIDVNACGADDGTALHLAAKYGHPKVVSLLIEKYNADVEAQDTHGNTPLYLAVTFCQLKIVSLLVEFGANVQAENRRGVSPLQMTMNYTSINRETFGKIRAILQPSAK